MASIRIRLDSDAADKLSNAVEEYMESTVLPKMVANAKRIVPVDTAALQNSIHYTVDDGRYYIGADMDYAPHVELGTSKMAAQPFLRPAVTTTQL